MGEEYGYHAGPPPLSIYPWDLAARYEGTKEIPGQKDNPAILAMLKLDGDWPDHDEVPWCSAFVNWIAWHLRLVRSKSLLARSWLRVGIPLPIEQARRGWDVVILARGTTAPGPDVINAPGHVGFFTSRTDTHVALLGGNQGDTVSVQSYALSRLLGVRRLHR